MDFWQLDKWNGFFPLKWHIIKDVPNTQLRHIVLENNENGAVTYSRDTQEVELKQGLEILTIFKNYSAKTCVLDDFFYEDREKALKAKRGVVPVSQPNNFSNGDYEVSLRNNSWCLWMLMQNIYCSIFSPLAKCCLRCVAHKQFDAAESAKKNQTDASSLVELTKNLSLEP